MGITAWLVLGLIAGFAGSKIAGHTGSDMRRNVVLGLIGAYVGGAVFTFFGGAGVTDFSIYSSLAATAGAVVTLFLYHAIGGRRRI